MTDKIFVTVGAQMAFDRLVHAVDRWAETTDRDVEVFGQVGPTTSPPTHVEYVESLDPSGFSTRTDWADVIVSHAGMGTIISALVDGIPLVILPRHGDLLETRNDHQIATMNRFRDRAGITGCDDETSLIEILERGEWSQPERIGARASETLIRRVQDFIDE